MLQKYQNKMKTKGFDALKRYESTEDDQEIWLHVPLGTLWFTNRDTHQLVEIKKKIQEDVYTILNRS